MDRQAELRRLCEADRHLANGERRLTQLEVVPEKLRCDGHHTSTAEKTLNECKASLDASRQHRETIIKLIEQIDQGLA